MKEWLKEFAAIAHDRLVLADDTRSIDQFLTDYLRDHPLPLPSDEEIAAKVKGEQMDVKWGFIIGVMWCREKMEGK